MYLAIATSIHAVLNKVTVLLLLTNFSSKPGQLIGLSDEANRTKTVQNLDHWRFPRLILALWPLHQPYIGSVYLADSTLASRLREIVVFNRFLIFSREARDFLVRQN